MAAADVENILEYEVQNRLEMLRLLDNDRKFEQKYCDVTLQSKSKSFVVHKVALGVISKYFDNLFRSDLKEKFAAVIKVEMEDENLERILDYIYTDVVNISTENALDILEDAEYTQIDVLKYKCANFILKMVDVDNCLKMLAYAQRYNLSKLVDKANQVISDNFAAVVQQEDFKQLKDNAMSAIIQHKNTKKQEEVVFAGIIQWIKFKPSRKPLFVNLFSQLDLSTFSGEFLNLNVITEDLVLENHQCCLAVMAAMKSFLPKKQMIPKEPDTTPPFKQQYRPQGSTNVLQLGSGGSDKQCILHDFSTKTYQWMPDMLVGVNGATVVKYIDRIFTFGGTGACMKSCQVFYIANKKWLHLTDMPEGRHDAACAVYNGLIYITGGCGLQGTQLSSCLIYDPNANRWSKGPDLSQPRSQHAMVEYNGLLVVIGGINCIVGLDSCERLINNAWSPFKSLSTPRLGLAAAVLGESMYAIGGAYEPWLVGMPWVERYHPRENTWSNIQPMNHGRLNHAVCVLQEKIYAVGGCNSLTVEVFDPEDGRWTDFLQSELFAGCAYIVAV